MWAHGPVCCHGGEWGSLETVSSWFLSFSTYPPLFIFSHSFILPFIHSSILPFIYSFVHSFIHYSFVHTAIHSFVPTSIHSFIHSFIHSLTSISSFVPSIDPSHSFLTVSVLYYQSGSVALMEFNRNTCSLRTIPCTSPLYFVVADLKVSTDLHTRSQLRIHA